MCATVNHLTEPLQSTPPQRRDERQLTLTAPRFSVLFQLSIHLSSLCIPYILPLHRHIKTMAPPTFTHEFSHSAFKGKVEIPLGLFINGEWVDSKDGKTIE
jgi:hypothetical protein